jgi:SAM-dependent methyltransferase
MEAEQELLRLCAGPAAGRAAAWERWIAALRRPEGDEEPYPAPWRDLLPLVALRQREGGYTGPDWLLSRLRTATLLEERRLVAVEDTAAEILAEPTIARHDPLMLGGLGLGETVYPHPATRHTGVITLLLRPSTALRPLMYDLVAKGYRTREGGWRTLHTPFRRYARLRLDHPSQMKLLLLSEPAWLSNRTLAHAALKANAMPVTAGKAHFLAPALRDALALTDLRLTGESPDNLVPQVDAALLRDGLSIGHLTPSRPATLGDSWTGFKSAVKSVPWLFGPIRSAFRLLPSERNARKRIWKERAHQLYQPGGRTEIDRYPRIFASLRDGLAHLPQPRVLSFGCSTGEELVTLRSYLPSAILAGIDINSHRISRARRKMRDRSTRFWVAGSIEETGAGTFDAITCLSVLHRPETVHNWPADPTPYLSFATFERAVIDLDRHLRPGGILAIDYMSFRFIDTVVAAHYTPIGALPKTGEPAKVYDRNNQPLVIPLSEHVSLWRKQS